MEGIKLTINVFMIYGKIVLRCGWKDGRDAAQGNLGVS